MQGLVLDIRGLLQNFFMCVHFEVTVVNFRALINPM